MNGLGRGEDNKNKEKHSLITKETAGMTLLLFSAIVLLIAFTRSLIFGDVGVAIMAFLFGCFGYLVYPILFLLLYASVVLISGKKFISGKWIALLSGLVCAVFLVVHLATSASFPGGYGEYLSACYAAGEGGIGTSTAGGAVFGLIVYPVKSLISVAGAYVLFSLIIVLALVLIARATPLKGKISLGTRTKKGKAPRTGEKRAYPADISFEELEAPARTSGIDRARAEREEAREMPASATDYVRSAMAEDDRRVQMQAARPLDPYQHSREILFSTDPATSYKNNLIYDSDSYFNSRARRNNAVTGTEGASYVSAVRSTPSTAESGSYSERYAARTDESRSRIPKKIVTERETPSGYSYPRAGESSLSQDAELNYPQRPSYKAEEAPSASADYYRNDVTPYGRGEDSPYEDEFSSAPNVADEPVAPRPEYRAETPSARPAADRSSRTDFTRAETPREEPPARTEYLSSDRNSRTDFTRAETPREEPPARTEYLSSDRTSRTDFTRAEISDEEPFEETPAPRAETPSRTAQDDSLSREAQFRSMFSRRADEEPEEEDEPPRPESRIYESPVADSIRNNADLLDDDDMDDDIPEIEEEPPRPAVSVRAPRTFERREERSESFAQPAAAAPAPEKHVFKEYVNPSVSLFSDYDDSVSVSQEEIERNSAIITETLAGFRVDAEVVKVTCGSAVTRYDIDIPKNIAVRSVIKHDAEIAMRLHARDGVNIYSNSEVGAISIEVPNSKRATVGLKSVIQAEEFRVSKPGALIFAIGKDVEGRNVCGNIVKMKHILVAGATGSGKSVCLNAMLISLICKYSPEDLRLILIDPKKVEFAIYDGLPHLMINEIIADAQKAVSALNWAIKEMERRYLLFEQKTRSGKLVHNVDEYNRSLNENEEKLPKVVIVVDELADLMSVAKKDIEDRIQRLSQKARAAGIHLVIATQRPSVDVITGVIKGNLPTRMAFRVIQEVDSRTILDSSGAEKLLGNGDMLYRTEGMFSSCRVQGAFLSSEEVQAVVEDIKAHNEAYFDANIADYINNADKGPSSDGGSDDMDGDSVDPQYIKALAIVVKLGSASISLIQRKCSVGYNHAGKIIEWMELMGYISPFDGKAKARTVLLSKEEFESKYGSLD